MLDHLAATLVGRQVLKQGGLAVERAYARGAEQLVRRERIEVAAEAAHVHIEVLYRLGAVDQRQGALAMGCVDQLRNRIHGAERVAYVAEGHQLGAGAELGMEILQVDLPGRRHPAGGQRRAAALAEQLPRHDVGVMLHFRDEHFVAGPEPAGQAGGGQVDPLGGASGEDELPGLARADQGGNLRASLLHRRGGLIGQQVGGAMDVGVVVLVVAANRIDDRLRLLRGGGAVEVGERLAVDPACEYREVAADV